MTEAVEYLDAYSEPGAALLAAAWGWHRWQPRWLPSRAAHVLRRWALRRYHELVLCRLDGGQRFLVHPSDLVQCEIGVTGQWEGLIYQAVRPLVPRGAVVVDVGAHVGYSTMLFADWVGPTGSVYCFEPLPTHIGQIGQSLALNGYEDRVTVNRCAVSDHAGSAGFYYDTTQNTGLGSLRPRRAQRRTLTVETVALDAWAQARHLTHIDLVKMDIEGAEGAALRGMAAGLGAHFYRLLLIELHAAELAAYGSSIDGVLSFLRARGYRVFPWEDAGRFVAEPVAWVPNYVLAVAPQLPLVEKDLRP